MYVAAVAVPAGVRLAVDLVDLIAGWTERPNLGIGHGNGRTESSGRMVVEDLDRFLL